MKTNALLDADAASTLIREDIAKQLDIHGSSRNLEIHNVFLKSKTVESKLVNFSVSSKDHPEKIDIKNAWAVPNLNTRHHSYNVKSLKETYTCLKDIILPNIEPTLTAKLKQCYFSHRNRFSRISLTCKTYSWQIRRTLCD